MPLARGSNKVQDPAVHKHTLFWLNRTVDPLSLTKGRVSLVIFVDVAESEGGGT